MPAGATYEPIATTTLGTAQSSISLSSIPATYTDLRVVFVGNMATSGGVPVIRFNDATTNYSMTGIRGDGTSAYSNQRITDTFIYMGYGANLSTTSNLVGMATADIFSYAGSTNKTCLNTAAIDKNGSGEVTRIVGLWRSTSAITKVTVTNDNAQNFSIGTTLTLYGIKAA